MRVLLLALVAISAMPEDRPAARRLLDAVPQMAAAVEAETAVVALWRAGSAYAPLDKVKAVDYLTQAFSAASHLPENSSEYRTEIVKAAAEVSLADAIDMLRVLPEPAPATERIVSLLTATRDFDRAIEILALTPESADYPFHAAARIFEKLPTDDPRRGLVFGRAAAAYARRPSGPFPQLLERYGSQVSRELAAQGVAAIARRIADWKDDSSSFHGQAAGEEQMELHSPNQIELRELMAALRASDPRAADELLSSRADIRAALASFRKARKPADPPSEISPAEESSEEPELSPPLTIGFAADLADFTRQLQQWSALGGKVEKVLAALKKNPREALEEAAGLPGPVRAEMLARIARSAAGKDPEWARAILDKSLAMVEEIGRPAERIMPSVAVAEAFHQLQEEGRAWNALQRALSDLIPVYRQDTRADRPNRALRDHWPSIQGCRMIMRSASKLLGAKAQMLLTSIPVADLALVARIEIARTLLGQAPDIHSIEVRW